MSAYFFEWNKVSGHICKGVSISPDSVPAVLFNARIQNLKLCPSATIPHTANPDTLPSVGLESARTLIPTTWLTEPLWANSFGCRSVLRVSRILGGFRFLLFRLGVCRFDLSSDLSYINCGACGFCEFTRLKDNDMTEATHAGRTRLSKQRFRTNSHPSGHRVRGRACCNELSKHYHCNTHRAPRSSPVDGCMAHWAIRDSLTWSALSHLHMIEGQSNPVKRRLGPTRGGDCRLLSSGEEAAHRFRQERSAISTGYWLLPVKCLLLRSERSCLKDR